MKKLLVELKQHTNELELWLNGQGSTPQLINAAEGIVRVVRALVPPLEEQEGAREAVSEARATGDAATLDAALARLRKAVAAIGRVAL